MHIQSNRLRDRCSQVEETTVNLRPDKLEWNENYVCRACQETTPISPILTKLTPYTTPLAVADTNGKRYCVMLALQNGLTQ